MELPLLPQSPLWPCLENRDVWGRTDHVTLRVSYISGRRKIAPEAVQAVRAAEQRGEDCRVCEQDVAAACAARRHPEEGIEFLVPGPGKRVRYRRLDCLLPQYPDRFGIIGRHRIMRQVRVEIERGYAFQPAARVEVAHCIERRDLTGFLDRGRTQAVAVFDGNAETLHQGACVATEPLLARHQLVAMVLVFHLTLVHVRRRADIMMRPDDQTGSFPRQELL